MKVQETRDVVYIRRTSGITKHRYGNASGGLLHCNLNLMQTCTLPSLSGMANSFFGHGKESAEVTSLTAKLTPNR